MDFDYQQLALRTKSPNFHELSGLDRSEFLHKLRAATEACEALDEYKKAMFYGKPITGPITVSFPQYDTEPLAQYDIPVDALHSILGIMTEAGELGRIIMDVVVEDIPFDHVNFREELGDVRWYTAIGAEAARTTLDFIDKLNIKKLLKRFGDKYSDADALNRDLDAELAVLKGE